jgi:hypothetical protein
MNLELAVLAVRRAWRPWPVGLLAGLAMLSLWLAHVDPRQLSPWLDTGGSVGERARWLTRAEALRWTLGLGWPILLWPAATTFAHWRRGEIDLLAGAGKRPLHWLASWGLGTAVGTCALLAAGWIAIGLATGWNAPLRAVEHGFDHQRLAVGGSTLGRRLELAAPAREPGAGAVLRLKLRAVGLASAADLSVQAQRAAGASSSAHARIWAASEVELPWPAGNGAVSVDLKVAGDGALLLLEAGGIRLAGPPDRSGGAATLALLATALPAAAGASALALGLGAWLHPTTVLFLLLAGALAGELALETAPKALAWLPWRNMASVLEALGQGLVLSQCGAVGLAGASAAVAAGWGLALLRGPNWRAQP